jgi:hypothetical protein
MQPSHIRRVLQSVLENPQIRDASGIPQIVLEFFQAAIRHIGDTTADWNSFLDQVEQNRDAEQWSSIRAALPA